LLELECIFRPSSDFCRQISETFAQIEIILTVPPSRWKQAIPASGDSQIPALANIILIFGSPGSGEPETLHRTARFPVSTQSGSHDFTKGG
jgi:hypothetical protein